MEIFGKRIFTALTLACLLGGLYAQSADAPAPSSAGAEPGLKMDYGLASMGMFSLQLYGGLKGLEIIPGAMSRALVYGGGGWVNDAYYRDLATGERLPAQQGTEFPDADFKRWFVQGKVGLDLGILYNEGLDKNMLYSMVFYKTMYSPFLEGDNAPTLFQTAYPDNKGFWENSLYAGLYLDLVRPNVAMQTLHGLAAELSADWAPGIGMNAVYGSADYLRFNATGKGFYTFFANEKIGLYLADRLIVDYLAGNTISAFARRNIGALDVYGGAGGTVRGMETGRYDGFVKLINNADLRFTMFPLFGGIVVPELFAFFDVAFVDNLDYAVDFAHGLYSTGCGLYINLVVGGFQFDLGYNITYSIAEKRWNFLNLVVGAHHF